MWGAALSSPEQGTSGPAALGLAVGKARPPGAGPGLREEVEAAESLWTGSEVEALSLWFPLPSMGRDTPPHPQLQC